MIPVLFTLIFAEMALIVIFVFKTPLRKLVIMGLDRLKRGHGPIVVKTVAGTVFVVMISSVHSIMKIQKRWIDEGDLNPTDQVLLSKQLLEASLMGFSLFLALMIDRLHHYIRELRIRRKSMEAVKKQNQVFEDGKSGSAKEIKALEEEKIALKAKVNQLESEFESKTKEANIAEANALALRKQSEGFLLEYDRLIEENQNLRNQLQSLDRRLSRSDSKKFV
ncbi:uncharacterized protein LOC130760078 [Actinidia eriantha]|uniref:uncharacterized protein LOC130760078 n=1 Tax=Actinidia eriantha TaxID=165200 RepID=UPI0025906301|nr:uncharacterized protein LOC130760078 [Actinidia eriantha]